MRNIKYTDSARFKCLEHLRETSFDLYLVHAGKEHCMPSHIWLGCKEEYVIHFVISGKGTFSVDGKTWELHEGQMFLIYPEEPVTYAADENDPWFYAWIGFNGIRVDSMLKNSGFSKNSLVMTYNSPKKMLSIIDQILETRQLSAANEWRRTAYMLTLFADLMDNYTALAQKKTNKYDYSSNIYVEHAIEYVKYMYSKGINVSDIANDIGISRTYLNHIFQKELGISVQKFLIDYRLHKAANLLMSTDESINEISKTVGHEDALAFSKAFKRKFEMSPKNYREHKEKMDKFTEKQI